MTARPFLLVDKATFYRFIADAPEKQRYEYVRGRIVQDMTGATLAHAKIALHVAMILSGKLDPACWTVTVSDRGVETSETIRCPDVVVEAAGAAETSLATSEPVLIVEVLSQTSGEQDLEIKPAEYLALPSLQAYIVASQSEPVCQMWLRGTDATFPALPATFEGRDQVIHIPSLSIAIPLAEVYRGIGQ